MRYFAIIAIFYCLPFLAWAQTVSGTIRDAQTKEVLPFANVMVAGSYKGTIANREGNYVLNTEGIRSQDTIQFSYLGYKTYRTGVENLKQNSDIFMVQETVSLQEVQVLSGKLTAEEIIERAEKNYGQNYEVYSDRQRFFYHKYEKVPFKKENQVVLKRSDFKGLDKKTFEDLFKKIPSEFISYQDAIVDVYRQKGEEKLVPLKAVSLEEGTNQKLAKEVESSLAVFLKDLENSLEDPKVYFKIRTGILGYKFDDKEAGSEGWNEYKKDTLNYTVPTEIIKSEIFFLLEDFGDMESKNWEFVTKRGNYTYQLEDITVLNDELVYKVDFKPKSKGLFEGTLYVSSSSFAILQLDFAFAKGIQTEKIRLFGFGHAMNFKEGRVIFEKGRKGYFVKYLHAKQQESASVDRNFSLIKKEKRFFLDKELNEMKFDVELVLDTETTWELLLLEREEIGTEQFSKANQPEMMKFRKEYAYTPQMWENSTVLAPSEELKKYKRK